MTPNSDKDCIFCKIAAGKIPSSKVYEDRQVMAFRDIHPQAPVHILIIPRKHYAALNEMTDKEEALLGHMTLTARNIAAAQGVAQSGYRVTINCGPDGGQVVQHVHLHLLGGRNLTGEMG
jgi:histidine triad (HIT) family protein